MVIGVTWPLSAPVLVMVDWPVGPFILPLGLVKADAIPGVCGVAMLPSPTGSHWLCPVKGSSMTRGEGGMCASAWRIEGDSSLQGLCNRTMVGLKGKMGVGVV